MPRESRFSTAELRAYEQRFDTSYEDKAVTSRGQFLRAYPLTRLKTLTVDDYVIGKGTASFCSFVEAKTKRWASIQGSPAYKFGIYFGRTKSDPTKKYRSTLKFGQSAKIAFGNVKAALLDLVKAGKSRDLQRIDENPLSQMFKAKILSLYFPDDYLNVCSSEHLEVMASQLGASDQPYVSEYQHFLAKEKAKNAITRSWSNPKFMRFLYSKFMRKQLDLLPSTKLKKPRRKAHRKVNFEDVIADRGAIGELGEKFALTWEKERLIGLGYQELVSKIDDRRNRPGYGYDFLSYSSPSRERHIEVKSVGRDRKAGGYRFYLSENQHFVSNSKGRTHDYYFYLVLYDDSGKPHRLLAKRATEVYSTGILTPCAYLMRFDLLEQDKE